MRLKSRWQFFTIHQPSRGWQAFVDHGKIPQSFRKARNCKFLRRKHCFLQPSGNRQFVVVKGLLWKQDVFRWELYKSRMSFGESSMKAGWLTLSALLYESRITLVECSTKAGWLSLSALRKQDDFRWVLKESRMTFVGCSTNAFKKRRKSQQYRVSRQDSVCWGSLLS